MTIHDDCSFLMKYGSGFHAQTHLLRIKDTYLYDRQNIQYYYDNELSFDQGERKKRWLTMDLYCTLYLILFFNFLSFSYFFK